MKRLNYILLVFWILIIGFYCHSLWKNRFVYLVDFGDPLAPQIREKLEERGYTYLHKNGTLEVKSSQFNEVIRFLQGHILLPRIYRHVYMYNMDNFVKDKGKDIQPDVLAVRYSYALENQLAMEIELFDDILVCAVKIPPADSISEKSTFTKASVILKIQKPGQLSNKTVKAIKTYISGALKNISFENIYVIDQTGHLYDLELSPDKK